MNPTTTQITLTVLLFAQLKDRLGVDELLLSLPQGATARDVVDYLRRTAPALGDALAVSRVAVNCDYVSLDGAVHDHDEVVIVPPVSGG